MSRPWIPLATLLVAALLAGPPGAQGQTRVLPLGDSITNGGQGHASYRYPLWFDLLAAGYSVDFVGTRNTGFDGAPNPAWYPDYLTTFDRDHEGYWGYRTDQIAGLVPAIAAAAQPDVALVHLGTNDIGQLGAAGVANADAYLRAILGELRAVSPDVVVLIARVIPIGPGTSYFANAAQVAPLNAVIADIAADSSSAQSPVIVVDQNTGFEVATMMQPDGLHPNLAGEARMADVWRTALAPYLSAGNPPPLVEITAPTHGTVVSPPGDLVITADATDPNGAVVAVRFLVDGVLLGADAAPPFAWTWNSPPAGVHGITAEAEDDEGAIRVSVSVSVSVLPWAGGEPIALANAGFELPPLADAILAPGPGLVGGWTFFGTPATYTGIFNPPAGSYPAAGGNASPAGAEGANVAYLFNNGGPGDSVYAELPAGAALAAGSDYLLRVAVGRFLPDQPYAFSTYGGFRIELRAGTGVIASAEDTILPPVGGFVDAFAAVDAASVPGALLGEPLSVRLDISAVSGPASTHFDDVRLFRRGAPTGAPSIAARGAAGIRVVPNPVRRGTALTLILPSPARPFDAVSVYDARGRRIRRAHPRTGANELRIPLELDVPPGVYFLALEPHGGPGIRVVVSE